MPALRKEKIIARVDPSCGSEVLDRWTATINVDSEGWFYCYPPDRVKDVLTRDLLTEYGAQKVYHRKKPGCFGARTLGDLVALMRKATQVANTPKVEQSLIIAYNIESYISFAEDEAGNIYPNPGYSGPNGEPVQWARTDKWSNDSHNAYGPFSGGPGGFGLIIGAKAFTKVTRTYSSDRVVTKYERFYGPGCNHHEQDHPAGRLNSWNCPLPDPDDCKQMPYTDEAAAFFSNLMMGMAKLSKQIQSVASDEQRLIEVANGGGRLLGFDDNEAT